MKNLLNNGDLKQRQSLPLQAKINKSIRTLEDFYMENDGDVYISTGGIDSCVLSWLAQQSDITKNIERVCVANLELKGNLLVNKKRGDKFIVSTLSKKDIICKYGYPIISKEVAQKISRYNCTKLESTRVKKLHGYIGRNGKLVTVGRIPFKYQPMIYAPFLIGDQCCDMTKKKPLKLYEKKTKKKPITGEMAEDSLARKMNYLKNGCIMRNNARVKCTPLGFWTKQDILKCVYENDIDYGKEEYGTIIKKDDGTYETTKAERTGCTICGFGILYDIERFNKKLTPRLRERILEGGEWVRKERYRWVKFRPNSIPVWSNLYWQPSDKGYGFKYVINYLFEVLKIDYRY